MTDYKDLYTEDKLGMDNILVSELSPIEDNNKINSVFTVTD